MHCQTTHGETAPLKATVPLVTDYFQCLAHSCHRLPTYMLYLLGK